MATHRPSVHRHPLAAGLQGSRASLAGHPGILGQQNSVASRQQDTQASLGTTDARIQQWPRVIYHIWNFATSDFCSKRSIRQPLANQFIRRTSARPSATVDLGFLLYSKRRLARGQRSLNYDKNSSLVLTSQGGERRGARQGRHEAAHA